MGTPVTDILNLAGLKAIRVHEEGEEYIIEAESVGVMAACPECPPGQGRLYGHGNQSQSFRDTPMHGKTVRVVVARRRYQCQGCRKTMFEPLAAMDGKRLATRRLIDYLHQHVFRETFAALARRVALDEKTVRNVFEDHVAELETTIRFHTPRVMGIDELKIVGDYRAVLTNIEQRCLFDLRPSRAKAELLTYFRALPDKTNIEWVTMDMYHVYRQIVRETLPKARIVVDRFHIQRMANEVLEKMRKRFRKTLPDRQRLKLKDERHLLLTRQHELTTEGFDRMKAWFQLFPQLGEAHALKEGFMAIWDSRDRATAEQAWQRWKGNLPSELSDDFKAPITAMTNWHYEIFNYFENPMTNAYTESANSLARVMNRMGRGYSFDVIRARMLYDPVARKKGSVVQQKAVPVEEVPPMRRITTRFMTADSTTKPRVRHVPEVIEYGAHVPTLERLADEGHFD